MCIFPVTADKLYITTYNLLHKSANYSASIRVYDIETAL